MPRKANVSVDDAVSVLIKYISYFASDQLPEWSSEVWNMMAKEPEFEIKWNVHSIRTNVTNNRRNILTSAREKCGYFSPITINNINCNDDDDEDNDNNDDDSNQDPDFFSNVYTNEHKNLDTFDVILSRDLWNSIKLTTPIAENDRNYDGFQPKIWTDTIAIEFWKQYRLKCAFIFKKGSIHQHGHHYATMIGHCKSKTCKNYLFGYIENDPGDIGDVSLKINCRDTRFEKHEDCNRPLAGKRRQLIKKSIKEKGVKSTFNEEEQKHRDPGDTQCPVMFEKNVLYHLKKESIQDEFDIKSEDRRDLIKALMCINEAPMYRDSIHLVGSIPFWVFYATPSQLHCYREYHRLHRQSSSICIDATGGVVKKFLDCKNERTSAIFLYQIVINFYHSSLSVFQMLSEAHDTDIITFWLKKWLRSGAVIPTEVVSDGSRALLNGISLAFNNLSLSDYIERCFNNVKGTTITKPHTYIRLDTAHFIHTISTWKIWKALFHKNIKSFYLYCVGLLMECKRLKDFEIIFVLILITSNTEYEDSVINYNGEYMSSLDARKKLETLIANKKTKTFVNNIETKIQTMEFDLEKSTLLNNAESDPLNENTTIRSWVTELVTSSENVISTGKTLNCFYVPTLKDSIIKEVKEFPLWTKVCIPNKDLRATSSYVEEDFKDLKIMLNKQITLPARVDIFVKAHLKNLLGGVVILQNKLTKFVDDNIDKSTISVDNSDCLDTEGGEKNSRDSVLKESDSLEPEIEEKKSIDADLEKNNSFCAKVKKRNLSFDEEFENNSPTSATLETTLFNENWRGLGKNEKHVKLDWINYDDESSYLPQDNIDNPNPKISTVKNEKLNLTDEISGNVVMSNASVSIESIRNDHDYSLKASTPLTSQVTEKNVLDAAVKKVGRKINKEGKHFKECPEIPFINNLVQSEKNKENIPAKKKKGNKVETYLLINGNKSGPVRYNGNSFLVQNTCPMDSIIQLLFNAALEDYNFREFLNNSKNPTFKLVLNLLNNGVRDDIYQERFSILFKIYEDNEIKTERNKIWVDEKTNKNMIISRVFDCQDNVTRLWSKLFEHEPSMFEKFSCTSPDCKKLQSNTSTMSVNYNTIINNGFKDLENAINFRGIFTRICPNCKDKIQICEQKLNAYIYIELDVKLRNEDKGWMCKLDDFPTYLNFTENKTKKLRYRLSGVIGYGDFHYISYCRRVSKEWRFYNDTLPQPKPINSHTKILPHGVLYLLESSTDN